MKLSLRSLFAAAGLLIASVGVGRAEEAGLAPNFEPFSTPDVQLVNHQCTDGCASGCTDSCNTCCSSRHVGRDFWVCKERCGGWVGGIDFLFLKPYASGATTATGSAQLNFEPAYRMYVGRQNADGLGARIRYFEFDRGDSGPAGDGLGVEFRALDIEATQAVDFRRWNLMFAGGLRYAETNLQLSLPGVLSVGGGFDGVGLTFAGQATRDLNKSGSLRLTSGARWSTLYGNSKGNFQILALPNTVIPVRDDLVNVLEINIGPQYRRQLRNGGYLTLGAGLEGQYWGNAIDIIPIPLIGVGSSDVGFAGFSTTFAITR